MALPIALGETTKECQNGFRKVCSLSQLIKPTYHKEAKKIFQGTNFTIYSCAASFKSDLTQGSIMKINNFCANMQMRMCEFCNDKRCI